jgi:hypothetical protein
MKSATPQPSDSCLSVEARLEVNALLERILNGDPHTFKAADAQRLVELVPKWRPLSILYRLGLSFTATAKGGQGPSVEGLTNAGAVRDAGDAQTKQWSSEPVPIRAGHFKVLHDANARTITFWHFMDTSPDAGPRYQITYVRSGAPRRLEEEVLRPVRLWLLLFRFTLELVSWKTIKRPA